MKLLKLPELENTPMCEGCFFYHHRGPITCTCIGLYKHPKPPCAVQSFIYVHPARLNNYLARRLVRGIRNLSLNSLKETS